MLRWFGSIRRVQCPTRCRNLVHRSFPQPLPFRAFRIPPRSDTWKLLRKWGLRLFAHRSAPLHSWLPFCTLCVIRNPFTSSRLSLPQLQQQQQQRTTTTLIDDHNRTQLCIVHVRHLVSRACINWLPSLSVPAHAGTGSPRSATTGRRSSTAAAGCRPHALKLSSFSCQTFGAAPRLDLSGSPYRGLTKSSCRRKLQRPRPRAARRHRHLPRCSLVQLSPTRGFGRPPHSAARDKNTLSLFAFLHTFLVLYVYLFLVFSLCLAIFKIHFWQNVNRLLLLSKFPLSWMPHNNSLLYDLTLLPGNSSNRNPPSPREK